LSNTETWPWWKPPTGRNSKHFTRRNADCRRRNAANSAVICNRSALLSDGTSQPLTGPGPSNSSTIRYANTQFMKFELVHALEGVEYITEHIKFEDFKMTLQQEWHYVAMVMDRIFLIIFSVAVLLGTPWHHSSKRRTCSTSIQQCRSGPRKDIATTAGLNDTVREFAVLTHLWLELLPK
uniref:Neur_chan_memb domain-containing protein n=1 Tax=Macrostomum lignano TaxID=282301 RepID=A0A1I8F7Y8_9PLAT